MSTQIEAKMKLDRLLEGVRYRASISLDTEFNGLVSDSRQVHAGQVFACIEKTEKEYEYVAQAFDKGAVAALVDDSVTDEDRRIIQVQQLDSSLSRIAGNYYENPSQHMTVIGVTGTNGKSTVCSWIEQLLQMSDKAAASIGTLGVHACGKQILEPDGMTTRDAIRAQQVLKFCRDAGAEAVAMEVSSHGMHQYRVESICFAVALFTNFSRDHLDYHDTEQDYWQAKKRLFDLPGIRCAVINIDDVKGRELAQELEGSMELISFSIEGNPKADISLSNIVFDGGFRAQLDSRWGAGSIDLPQMTAEFELSNMLAALAVTSYLNVPLDTSLSQLPRLQSAQGRLELIGSIRNSKVYVDYAHTPEAVERVLSALKRANPARLITVLGCGGDRDAGKRPLMASSALRFCDQLIITSDNPRSEPQDQIERDMLEGVEDMTRVKCISDRKAAIRFAIEKAPSDSCIAILGKGHESGQIFADRIEPFSDIQVSREILRDLAEKGSAPS